MTMIFKRFLCWLFGHTPAYDPDHERAQRHRRCQRCGRRQYMHPGIGWVDIIEYHP